MTPDNLNYYTSKGRAAIGRYCELEGLKEVKALKAGMDFRRPECRREVWLRFYEFHLKYRSHPGAVYYVMPYLFKKLKMTQEQRLWFAFINGNSQHVVSTLTIFRRFPDFERLDFKKLSAYFNENYASFGWDIDRRYHRKEFLRAVEVYRSLCDGSQVDFFKQFTVKNDEEETFRRTWAKVRKDFWGFGRLSTFSYLEYLRIAGLSLDCDDLLLEDMSGSKSHRNGLAKVLGRDDLDWHAPGFDGDYVPGQVAWLKAEAAQLRKEARARFKGRDFAYDVGYFTMESTFCTYKSWHRKNRRYPNIYNDLFFRRIRDSERAFPEEDYSMLWAARWAALPPHLRLESSPNDPGLCPAKQNHYRDTGQVVMMDKEWSCFKNDFNRGARGIINTV
jgi:hypothetical protein